MPMAIDAATAGHGLFEASPYHAATTITLDKEPPSAVANKTRNVIVRALDSSTDSPDTAPKPATVQ